jgi:hypothetical protein
MLIYGIDSIHRKLDLLETDFNLIRVFDQNESPDVTNRDIPNLFEESQPDFIDNAFNSPARYIKA